MLDGEGHMIQGSSSPQLTTIRAQSVPNHLPDNHRHLNEASPYRLPLAQISTPVLWPVNSWTLNKMVAVLSYQVWGMVCYAARANCYSPLFRFTFHGFCRNLFFPTYKEESIVWIYLQLIVIRVSDGKKDESAKVPVIMKQQSGWVGKTWQITIMKGENNKDHKGVMNIRKWHSEKKTCC